MRRLIEVLLPVGIALAWPGAVRATGYYGPDSYLDRGGENVTASPEFYWDLELKRIAHQFSVQEKLRARSQPAEDSVTELAARSQTTVDADVADFAAALQEGRIKPPEAARATQQHEAARALVATTDDKSTTTLPEEFDSEFADYHRGAFAYRLGSAHWEEARQAWKALLERPAEARHYRTVWATFMLAKISLKKLEPEASALFQRTRELAQQGFADSLGLAADSYGWEGRSEWKQGHPEKAAPLFLTQLALGDESAVVSLKALIPDRAPTEGMLNYGPEEEERNSWTEEQKRAQTEKESAALKVAAQDPLLRRLVTAHILATATAPNYWGADSGVATARSKHWLEEMKAAKLGRVEDAEYLGWAAYSCGDYKESERWLTLAGNESPAAHWLRAKLQRRAGKIAEAAQSMAEAWKVIRDPAAYTRWKPVAGHEGDENTSSPDGPSWSFPQAASGDLAALRLVRGDFVQAFDTFLRGGLGDDAAFVAERVLTTEELKKYVDEMLEAAATDRDDPERVRADWRYVLGRRLVRDDRYEDAAQYLASPYDKIVGNYAKALRDGADAKLPKAERAAAWFHAAWIARYDGMELMGTEVAPDAFNSGGSFEASDVAKERLTGTYQKVQYSANGEEKKTTVPLPLRPSAEEVKRLRKNKIEPDVRFHYRVIAGALAMKAAQLLPDQSAELADVINTAGNWVKDRDEKIGNGYFAALDRRAARTELGRQASAKHWFVDMSGPWSDREGAAFDAMHKELGLEKAEE